MDDKVTEIVPKCVGVNVYFNISHIDFNWNVKALPCFMCNSIIPTDDSTISKVHKLFIQKHWFISHIKFNNSHYDFKTYFFLFIHRWSRMGKRKTFINFKKKLSNGKSFPFPTLLDFLIWFWRFYYELWKQFVCFEVKVLLIIAFLFFISCMKQ